MLAPTKEVGMGFLDKLLGRGEQVADKAADTAKERRDKGLDMAEDAGDKAKDVAERPATTRRRTCSRTEGSHLRSVTTLAGHSGERHPRRRRDLASISGGPIQAIRSTRSSSSRRRFGHLGHASEHGERRSPRARGREAEADADRHLDRLQADPEEDAAPVVDPVREQRERDTACTIPTFPGQNGKAMATFIITRTSAAAVNETSMLKARNVV